jgi:beta-lactam-binding protein with PASTA domain
LQAKKLDLGQVTTKKTGKQAGTVIDQDPKPGGSFPSDNRVAVVLEGGGGGGSTSSGNAGGPPPADNGTPTAATVPDLTGMTQDQAQAALTKVNLVLGTTTAVLSEKPEGTVVEQDTPAGEQIATGQTVGVKIASSGTVPVPDLRGKTKEQAEQALQQAQLQGVANMVLTNDPGAVNTVIHQSIAPGLKIAKMQNVQYDIKQDSTPAPNVVGLNEKDALLAVYRAQLVPVESHRPLALPGLTSEGRVLSQGVAAGTLLPKQSQLAFIYATPPVPTRFGQVVIPNAYYKVSPDGRKELLTGAAATRLALPR